VTVLMVVGTVGRVDEQEVDEVFSSAGGEETG
jgi:hypothetical protein